MNTIQRVRMFALIACLLVVLSACGGGDEATNAAPDSAANTSNASSAVDSDATSVLPSDPAEAIKQAVKNQNAAGAYRVKTVLESAQGKMEMTSEVIPPDQMRVVMDMGEQTQEMVFIGEKGWMKMGGDWTESSIQGSAIMSQIGTLNEKMLEAMSDFAEAGSETVDGVESRVFTYKVELSGEGDAAMAVKSSVKLYVDVARGLPIKQEVEGEAMGVKSTSVQMIEYDSSIQIEAPVK